MPVTIKSGNIQYKSTSSGEYVGINSVSERTTAEQVADLTEAGSQQRQSIDHLGQEVLDSIPSDYTNLSNDVDSLKSAIGVDRHNLYLLQKETGEYELSPKIYNGSVGNPGNTNYVCTGSAAENKDQIIIEVDEGDAVTCRINRALDSGADAYGIAVSFFNANKERDTSAELDYTYTTSNFHRTITIPHGYKYVSFSIKETYGTSRTPIQLRETQFAPDDVIIQIKTAANGIKQDIDDLFSFRDSTDIQLKDIENNLYGYEITPVSVYNGSIGNPGNTNAVAIANLDAHIDDMIPAKEGDVFSCRIDRPVDATGANYGIAYGAYNSSKTRIGELDGPVYNTEPIRTTNAMPANTAFVAFEIYEKNSQGQYIPLRETGFSFGDVKILLNKNISGSIASRLKYAETEIDSIHDEQEKQDCRIENLEEKYGYKSVIPFIFNGSVGNPGNTTMVSTGNMESHINNITPVNPGEYVLCKIKRPVDATGAIYGIVCSYFNSSKVKQMDTEIEYNASGELLVQVPSGMAYLAFGIAEKNALNVTITLRETMFTPGDIEMRIYAKDPETIAMIERNKDVLGAVHASSMYGVNGYGQQNYKKKYSMLVTTDVHGSVQTFANAIQYLNTILSLDSGICLGDIVEGNFSDSSDWYNQNVALSSKLFYTVIGNHDVGNSKEVTKAGTKAEVLAKFITPNESKMGKSGMTTLYYSFYDSSKKLYFIVLNNYDSPDTLISSDEFAIFKGAECYSQDQLNWFISELNNVPSDYELVLIRHSYYEANTRYECNFSQPYRILEGNGRYCYGTTDIVPLIINAWINGEAVTATFEPESDYAAYLDAISVNADFTSRGAGNFVCHLVGHSHADVVSHSTTYPHQLIVGFCATAFDNWDNASSDLPRVKNEKSMDAITVFSIDTDTKSVNLVRVGSNKTTWMIDRTMVRIPYDN